MNDPSLAEIRARYAHLLIERFGAADAALEAAFARVPREKFLGRGPWRIAAAGAYRLSDSDDPREVYVDNLIALDAARHINNGEPSAHALWIHALALMPGERVNHIGAGTGYYTAILAELVGEAGRVEAFEIDPDLAARAATNLGDRGNVVVHAESGVDRALPLADAIYVNAGATGPNEAWLDALNVGGRLVFPLTGENGWGAMLCITRSEGARWPVTYVSGAGFIDLVGGRDAKTGAAVSAAFRRGGAETARWFLRGQVSHGEADWLRGKGWRFTR
jgi:protein-L-isoaspartate(D-aspartate) O-methyltransferase